jgi:Protein kinase domain
MTDVSSLFAFSSIGKIWNLDKIISKSTIQGKQCVAICGRYQFIFRPDVSNYAPITEQNKSMYIRKFFKVFFLQVFYKIQMQITAKRVKFHPNNVNPVPDPINRVYFLVTFIDDSMVFKTVLAGDTECELETITIPFILDGSKKIGEGSYGCLHSPSLVCKEDQVSGFYSGKVSKILSKIHMLEEMEQYKLIDLIDPDYKYHPSAISCTPKIDTYMLNSVGKCKKGPEMYNSLGDYKLIIMDNGGHDLVKVCNDTQWTELTVRDFYVDALSLFEAVLMFGKSLFVHQDIKPANVVYNTSTRKMKVIDFGLSDTMENIYNRIDNEDYESLAIFHYNFPPELFIFRKKPYAYNRTTDHLKFERLLHSIIKFNNINDEPSRQAFYADSEAHFNEYAMKQDTLDDDDVMESIVTIDSYALGITLQYMMNTVPRFAGFTSFYNSLNKIITSLLCMNVRQRMDIDTAIIRYKAAIALLSAHGDRDAEAEERRAITDRKSAEFARWAEQHQTGAGRTRRRRKLTTTRKGARRRKYK